MVGRLRLLIFRLCLLSKLVATLPKPSGSSHAQELPDSNNDSVWTNGKLDVTNLKARAATPMDIPTGTQQSEHMYSESGLNGTTPEPGFIPALSITRQEVDCSDLSTGRDNKCWDELQLTTWVESWIAENTCYQDEAFASCFLRQVGYPELDCTGIKLVTCTPPTSEDRMDTRVFYVAFNIYALTGIFAVAPGLGFNVGSMLDKAVQDATQIAQSLRTGLQFVENALIGFPQIGRYLYPIDTPASAIIQIADLKNKLGDLVAQVQSNLNKTVTSVMADPREFLAFASQGNFTASAPSLPDQTQYLLYAFNTYIISAGLRGNNIYGTVAKDTNVQALATNGSRVNEAFDLSACEGYNSENVCDTWWYSGFYDSTFSLDHFSHMERGHGDVMTQLFQKYTTGQLLFDNAYGCNLNGNFGKNVSVTVNPEGINTQCLSQLRILTWDMGCEGVRDKQCEFLEDEGPQGGWLGDCGSHSYFSVMDEPLYCVPNGYLGPLVNQREYKLQRD
ncbi:MAG: hypothetical protein Q9183_004320 [Haloplaca sp. 2 TL-2023]